MGHTSIAPYPIEKKEETLKPLIIPHLGQRSSSYEAMYRI